MPGFVKGIEYVSCYSNWAFELWIILHKMECAKNVADKNNYLPIIDKVFKKSYEGLKEYKEEKRFKDILDSTTIEDVKKAISRAEEITKSNSKDKKNMRHGKWDWYRENPATKAGTAIKDVLQECGVMRG